jgi:hypothetical protein
MDASWLARIVRPAHASTAREQRRADGLDAGKTLA